MKRAPFGWPTLRLEPSQSFKIRWPQPQTASDQGGWLRIATSIDDRQEKILSVHSTGRGNLLGTIDLRFAHSLEPFQLRLDPDTYNAAVREGLRLTLTQAQSPLWLLAHDLPAGAESFSPRLVPDKPGDTEKAFFERLGSLASIQPFGWMEGCVLDGLFDLHEATGEHRWRGALDEHLAKFITPDGNLVYEDPRSFPADNRIHGIEDTLPFAQLAKVSPDHPLLDLVLDYYRGKLLSDGSFVAPELFSAEGSYTITYPLAVIAQQRQDTSLAAVAANVLRVRRTHLFRSDGIWLRYHPDDTLSFRSWARGVAWYLLGLERSLEHLKGLADTEDLKTGLRDAAAWALSWQRSDGLWGCFLDDKETLVDTSGSAGIAAAFARGANAGLLDAGSLSAAKLCWKGLLPFLTPDGFLDGAAQSNRGGESLQRGPYRVLSPMGMGLMGQLAAALNLSASRDPLVADETAIHP
jgi:unsaturated rhamnogalacturonyl hydrolase